MGIIQAQERLSSPGRERDAASTRLRSVRRHGGSQAPCPSATTLHAVPSSPAWAPSRRSATTTPRSGANAVAGVSGGGPITHFDASDLDVRIAAEVKGFDPTVAMNPKMARRMSRFIHLGMAAGKEAMADAGLDFDGLEPRAARPRGRRGEHRRAAAWRRSSRARRRSSTRGARFVSPFAIPALSGSMAACQLSMEYGLTGPVITQVAACASLGHLLPRRAADDPARRGRRRRRGRHGGAAPADGLRGALATWARSPSATTSPSTPRGPSTGTATGSSSARARASSCSRARSTRWSAARPSRPRSSARR